MEDNLRELADLGYKGIDIWRSPNALGDPDGFKELLDKSGLEAICMTILRQNMMGKQTIDYASTIGARYINTHAFIDLMDENLVEYAAEKEIRFVIHPHHRTPVENIQDLSKYLSKHPKLMLCLDTANLAATGSSPRQAIEMFGDRLGLIHLKDWDQDTRRPCELGEGTLDIPGVFRTLKKVNYSDWFVVECANLGSKGSAIKCRDYLRQQGFWST